jgi:hypothetical protein
MPSSTTISVDSGMPQDVLKVSFVSASPPMDFWERQGWKWPQFLTQSSETWNTIRQAVASNSNLAKVGRRHGLGQCAVLNPGTVGVSNRTMATLVEAIIGAVSQDSDDAAVEDVLSRLGIDHELLKPVTSV